MLWISRLPGTWITLEELYRTISSVYKLPCLCFKSLQLLQLISRMLQRCFAVKRQKCFVGTHLMTEFCFCLTVIVLKKPYHLQHMRFMF